jgi:hypothetical protein
VRDDLNRVVSALLLGPCSSACSLAGGLVEGRFKLNRFIIPAHLSDTLAMTIGCLAEERKPWRLEFVGCLEPDGSAHGP